MTIHRTGRIMLLAALMAITLPGARTEAGPLLLFDPANNRVLYAENPDQLWYPASLTKIMTAYVVFEAMKNKQLTLETKVISSETAALAPPSKIGLPVGSEISLELALRALIVKSANDIAIMLAETVAGTEAAFIDRMNETARRLGMARTHFVNPNGLPIMGQVTTARDLARLAKAVLRDFPEHAHFWAEPTMRIGKSRLRSFNPLLRKFDGADGIKTGFICDSGFNIVASAKRDGRKLIAIVLGSTSAGDRAFRARHMLEHGFLTRDWKLHFNPVTLDTMPVSTASDEVVSIRQDVKGWSCGNRTVTRRSAREKRLQLIRRATEKRKLAPAQVTLPVKNTTGASNY